MTDILATLEARLEPVGINLVGATSVAAYDPRVPPPRRLAHHTGAPRGVIVLGNGGRAMWDAARAVIEHGGSRDPLDDFTRAVVCTAIADVAGAHARFPFEDPATAPDFQLLAELAGLGRRSLVGVLVHPEYGPWIALRAAVLVPDAVIAPRPVEGFDPCPTCIERPCIAACPVAAVGPAGWNVERCSTHRLAHEAHCAAGCGARIECVYGRAHRHPVEALAFHQAAARRAMAAYASAARKA